MSLLFALALATAAHTEANCSWDHPGGNPFTGDPVAAIDHYTDISPDIRAALKERIAARHSDEIVTIHRDSISGKHEYDPQIRDMHFGAATVCGTVSRAQWKPRKVERALVYCEQGECIIVPAICGNVSRVTRLPDKIAEAEAPPPPTPVIPVTPQQMASLVHMGPAPIAEEEDPKPTPLAVVRVLYSPPTVLPPTPVVISNNIPVRAVPEPGTWAMLVAGLAFVGFVARRRRGN